MIIHYSELPSTTTSKHKNILAYSLNDKRVQRINLLNLDF
jgi:hypothetical protein